MYAGRSAVYDLARGTPIRRDKHPYACPSPCNTSLIVSNTALWTIRRRVLALNNDRISDGKPCNRRSKQTTYQSLAYAILLSSRTTCPPNVSSRWGIHTLCWHFYRFAMIFYPRLDSSNTHTPLASLVLLTLWHVVQASNCS